MKMVVDDVVPVIVLDEDELDLAATAVREQAKAWEDEIKQMTRTRAFCGDFTPRQSVSMTALIDVYSQTLNRLEKWLCDYVAVHGEIGQYKNIPEREDGE
jgi:hypothetical protein